MKHSRRPSALRTVFVGAAAAGAAVLLPATAAFAQSYPLPQNPETPAEDTEVAGEVVEITEGTPVSGGNGTEVAGVTLTRNELPFTGGDVLALSAVGLGAVAAGGGLLVASRKARQAHAEV